MLASLELARAQASVEGHQLIENALSNASAIRHAIRDFPSLKGYRIHDQLDLIDDYTTLDPLRFAIDVSKVSRDVRLLKQRLFKDSHRGAYISRITDQTILVNVHIGVSRDDVTWLLKQLAEMAASASPSTCHLKDPHEHLHQRQTDFPDR